MRRLIGFEKRMWLMLFLFCSNNRVLQLQTGDRQQVFQSVCLETREEVVWRIRTGLDIWPETPR